MIEAMKQWLEALEDATKHIFLGDKNGVEANIRAHKQCESLRQAIAEAERQEPVAIVSSVEGTGDKAVRIKWLGGFPQIGLRLYLHLQPNAEKQKQSPEGSFMTREQAIEFCRRTRPNIEPTEQHIAATIDAYSALLGNLIPADTHPQPKREWVDLTQEEILNLGAEIVNFHYAAAIAAKLKEKNS